MTPKEIFQSIKRPLTLGLALGIATALITLFIANRYTSVAHVLPSQTSSGGLGQLAANFGIALPSQAAADDAYPDILNSRWMAEQLLKRTYTFSIRPWRFGREEKKTQTLMAYLEARDLDQGLMEFRDLFSASQDFKSKLLTLRATTLSPELSQQVCQGALDLLNDFVVNQSRTRGSNKAAFARQRLEDARQAKNKAEAEFRAFLSVNRNYQSCADPEIRFRGLRLEQELQLRNQLTSSLAMSLEQALMDEKNDQPVLNVVDQANLPIQKSGPPRSRICLLTFLVTTLGAWAWPHRRRIWSFLTPKGPRESMDATD